MKFLLALALAFGAAGCSTSPRPSAEMPASQSTKTLSAGDAAPPFSLSDSTGSEVSLESLTASGPAVLVFYRGDW